jgi:hypothetical protein
MPRRLAMKPRLILGVLAVCGFLAWGLTGGVYVYEAT